MKPAHDLKLTRRDLGCVAVALAGVALLPGLGHAEAGAIPLVPDKPELAGVAQALQYVNASPFPDKNCANCVLFQPAGDGVGACPLFQAAQVKATGHCTSWAPKPA